MNLTKVASLPGSGGGALAWQPPEVWAKPAPPKETLPPGWPFPMGEPKPAKAKKVARPVRAMVLQDVMDAAVALMKRTDRATVKKVLWQFGAARVADLEPEHYGRAVRAFEAIDG